MKILFHFLSIGLFIAGYVNSESKPDLTDTAPKKDRMKDAVEWSKLQNRNGDTYIPNTDKPYSGWAKQTYDNGQVKVLAEFTDGTVTRLKQWQENGIPRWDIGYSKGKVSPSDVPLEDWRDSNTSLQHGLNTIWYENGQKIGQVNFKKGKEEGLFTVWYENGKIKRIGNYKDGKLDGVLRGWREDDGQKSYEVNFKDGKKHGLMTRWHVNGKKDSEENYKDDKKHGLATSWYFIGQKAYENIYKEGKLMFAKVWKPNGEKCPVTNVQNGNGVWVLYDGYDDKNMDEMFRYTYKDGVEVEQAPPPPAEPEPTPEPEPESPALKIAYSDWPGWVAWEIAIQKNWFEDEGVEVEFLWFDYVASMDAYVAGQVDAVCMTNGDALVTGATGKPSVGIIVNDYSNGNDMVVAKPGIESVTDLKGKSVGVEEGFVCHLLLLKALEENGMSAEDVTIVNTPTDETPQVLASGDVDAIAAWQPNSGQALKSLPGSKPIFTSADAPGIIYDLLCVSSESLEANKGEWAKVVKVWYKIVDYLADEANMDEALKILSARVSLEPAEYEPFFKGTKILTLEEALTFWSEGEGLDSVYGSTEIVDDFNVKFEVYLEPLDTRKYLDPSLTKAYAVPLSPAPPPGPPPNFIPPSPPPAQTR